MRKYLLLLSLLFCASILNAQVTVSGASAGNGSYTTLGAAFTAITSATGTITINITGNTSETAAGATLAAGTWTSITIAPTGGPWTISGAATAGNPLITFNGSDNVTINGLSKLIFSNTTVSATAGTSTLKLTADATNNTFNNVTFLTAATMEAGINGGAVWVSTATTTGNDYNSFQYCKFSSSTTNSGVLFYARGSVGSTAAENNNVTINGCEFYDYFLASGTQAAIYVGIGNTACSIANNKIYQTATRTITASSTVYGIYCVNAGVTALGENFTITTNTIGSNNNAGTGTMTYAAGTTAGGFTGIFFNGSSASTETNTISYNTICNIQWTSSSGSAFIGISTSSLLSSTVGNTLNINSNQIMNITSVTSTGELIGILSGYTPSVSISNNTIDNITRSGEGVFYAIQYSGNSTSSHTLNLNTISNLSVTSTTSTSAFYGIYSGSSPATEILTNNTIDGLTSSSTASNTVMGINNPTATTGNKTCQSNIVKNISLPASSTGTAYGIRIAYLGAGNSIAANTIHTITGGTNIYGMLVGGYAAASAITSVYKNKIYGLSNSVNAATNVYGLVLGTQGTSSNCHVYNNIIGDLTSSAATNTTDAVRGVSITSASLTSNIYLTYNTVYLTGSASSGTNFATSALYHSYDATATTASLTLKNNIFVNNYPSKGSGVSASFKRSASTDLNNYSTSSNNNLFYGTNIYYDGTNTDASMAAFKSRVTTRETVSFSENPTWVSTTGSSANFLHIDATAPTQIESGGTPISSPFAVTQDFDGETRNLFTPDVGADEGSFTADPVPMSYSSSTTEQVTGLVYVGAANQSIIRVKIVTTGTLSPLSLTSLTLNANGTTAIGDINAATAKVYYTGSSTTFSTSTLFGSLTPTIANFTVTGTQILSEGNNYFWLAYDVAVAALNSNLIDGECIDLTVGSTYTPTATAPSGSRSIVGTLSGTYSIGASQTLPNYTLLADAIAHLNAYGVSGAVTLQLTSDYSAWGETFPLTIHAITGASATNTITIKPAATVAANISGSVSSGALIKLNGADYVTINGSNSGGTDRSLTITNTATTAPTAVSIISLGVGTGATNNTIKNCNISTGGQTTTGYGIAIGGSTPGTTGADNDNTTIQNNSITACVVGIYAQGTAITTSGGNDNLNITSNTVTYNSTLASNVGINVNNSLTSSINQNTVSITTSATSGTSIAMQLAGTTGATVSQNTVSVTTAATTAPVGISLETDFVSSTVTRNYIYAIESTNTGGYGGRGITIGTGTATSALTLSNNAMYGVNGSNWSGFANSSSVGIFIGVIGGGTAITTVAGGINLYNNTVKMHGGYSTATACLTAALYVGYGASALDIRNNIFYNALYNYDGTFGATSKAYAIYSAAPSSAFTTINYNNYYVSGTQGVLGYLSSDITDLAGIVTGFAGNANSYNADPDFDAPTANTMTITYRLGTNISGVTTDYSGTTRSNPPDIGAYEGVVANRWIGATNTVWSTGTNWDNGSAPASNQSVTIAENSLNNPALGADVTVNGIVIEGSSTVSIGSNTLTVNGAVSGTGTISGTSTSNVTIAGTAGTLNFTSGSRVLNNLSLGGSGSATLGTALDIYGTVGFTVGGNLNMNAQVVTLKSNITATARVSNLTGSTLSGASNVITETYIPSGRRAYRFLGHPFSTTLNMSSLIDDIYVTGTGGAANGFDATTNNNPSSYWFDNLTGATGTWTAFTHGSTDNSWTQYRGIRALVRGDRTQTGTLDGTNPTPNAVTIDMTGTLNTGNQNISVPTAGSYHLVGNPYPSPVDIGTVFDATTNRGTQYWVWDANAVTKGAFVTRADGLGAYNLAMNGAFIMQPSGGAATLAFTEANKTATATANLFETKGSSGLLQLQLQFEGRHADNMFVRFDKDYKNEFDNKDGEKLLGSEVNFYSTILDGKKLSLDSRPFAKEGIIPITITSTLQSAFKFVVLDNGIELGLEVYLKDKLKNTLTKLDAGSVYDFEVTADANTQGANRFELVMQKAPELIAPVTSLTVSVGPNPPVIL
jgi:hypothetical protein